MAFSILDHVSKLEPAGKGKPGKFICPACGGNDFSYNEEDGSYNCWNDPSDRHRAEIRNILAPMKRWERPQRPSTTYRFPYKNKAGENVLEVVRDDTSGKKNIRQTYPTVGQDIPQRKALINDIRNGILPYRYHEAIEASSALKKPIFVVEGELCCDKLWQIGLPSVTFLGGSGQYRANGDYTTLFRGHRLVLCPDRDEPGVALMKEVAADNPGSQFLYAEPDSFEWDNLPQNAGYDIGDWIDDGADEELLLKSIVSKDRHQGKDGKPSYEEIITTLERMVGLYGNDARIAYETQEWLNMHGIKMPGNVVEKILNEAKNRLQGKEEMEVLDAKNIALSEDARKWTIAGILPESSVMLLAAAPGSGKAQPLWSKVLTPNGWKAMGDIRQGDEVVAGNGTITRVSHVFPQGVKPVYRVTMSDGSITHCCDEHLWLTKTADDRCKKRDFSVKSLAAIKNTLDADKTGKRNHSIPMTGPIQFEKKNLPIHPYLLGVILGDGSVAGNCNLYLSDEEITNRVEKLLPHRHELVLVETKGNCKNYRIVQNGLNGIRGILRDLDLMGKRSWEKHVPEDYLYSSVQDRLDLLHGLMDTDGTTGGSSTTFDSSSLQLAQAVQFIVRSLGGKATMQQRTTFFTYLGKKKPGRISYRVTIAMPPGFKSFSVSAKANKEITRTKYLPTRLFDSVEYIGDEECQCIMVDHPDHTYLTDDMIVTHNSTMLYNWAFHVATGRPWSKRRCKKGKCLIIQCDEPVVDAAEKLQIIGYADDDLDFNNIGFVENWRFTNIPQLVSWIKKDRPQLVMIDSLTSCLAGMDVDLIRSDAGNSIYELRDIANQYGCSIVILHHLNKSGGIRDSSSFEANVSEVVKLYRPDNNPDPQQFILEWSKSRSGLSGKHFLHRDPSAYGWFYKGPVDGGDIEMEQLINALDNRAHERFTRHQAAQAINSFNSPMVGRALEQARRQGLITSSWQVGPNGERTRLYHSWDYEEPSADSFVPQPSPQEAPPAGEEWF